MKKFVALMAVAVLVFFASPSMACQGYGGMAGLEISGGSLVGVQGYIGKAYTVSETHNCFEASRTISGQIFAGANLVTGANSTACVKTQGNANGSVCGTGNFEAGIEGSIYGVDFYTNSSVTISGHAY